MRSPRVSPLAQIEWTIGDLDAPRELLSNLFGSRPIEEEFSSALEGPHMEILHLGFGQTVLQLCHPLIDATGHWHALAEKGPHVYNLTFFVDDLSVVLERCAVAKVDLEWHFPLGEIYKRIVSSDNLSGSLEAAMIASREKVGFNLEIAETFWAREPEPRILYPAYHPDWPATSNERVGPLELINIETGDISTALQTLSAIFGDSLVTVLPLTLNTTEDVYEAVVEIGRVRLHYVQSVSDSEQPPESARNAIDARLPRVQSLAIPASNRREVERAVKNAGLTVEDCPSYLFEPMRNENAGTQRIRTTGILGIDIVLR